ncbi:hypothetical protein E2C01_066649 [Portunus trituberculatus]|uniref:Uncharacterized protein n=1 Tax=Portunus trituberculatus TaxID=210409 RepID=A0A5B7HR26_PORTR|nr:hypothetical protein [Portunus trituberculatus]
MSRTAPGGETRPGPSPPLPPLPLPTEKTHHAYKFVGRTEGGRNCKVEHAPPRPCYSRPYSTHPRTRLGLSA